VVKKVRKTSSFRRHLRLAKVPVKALTRLYQEQPERAKEKIEVPCTRCTVEITFDIPANVKQGWVIRGHRRGRGKPKERVRYARVSKIEKIGDYESAYERVCQRLTAKFGEAIFELLPKEIIQEQLQMSPDPSRAINRVLKEAKQIIKRLPAVGITLHEARKGQAERVFKPRECEVCGGTGRVDCVTCKGTGRVEVKLTGKWLIERIRSNREFRWMWEKTLIQQGIPPTIDPELLVRRDVTAVVWEPCRKCAGRGKKSCSCISTMVVRIPQGVRAGWVVRVGSSDYARVGRIVPVSVPQLREWMIEGRYWGSMILSCVFSPWYPVGQLWALVIGVLSLWEGPWKGIDARISLQKQLTAGLHYGSRLWDGLQDALTTEGLSLRDIRWPEFSLPQQAGILLLLGGFLLIVVLAMRLRHLKHSGPGWCQALYDAYAALWSPPLFHRGTWTPPLSGSVVGIIKLLYYMVYLVSSWWFTLPIAVATGLVGLVSLLAGWESDHLPASIFGGYGLLVAIQVILPVLSSRPGTEATYPAIEEETRNTEHSGASRKCLICGTPVTPDVPVCPSCIMIVKSGSPGKCRVCGASIAVDEVFCASCYARLRERMLTRE
jgi:hypothetical protein